MDLLSISRVIWKHKLLVLPVIVLTFAAAFYFLAFSKPLYGMTTDYVLAPPPSAPTPAQIAADPSLGGINSNSNVYARFYDQSIIADAVVARMASDQVQSSLLKQGADPRNTTTITSVNGSTEPGVEVLATGSTAAEALKTNDLVGASLQRNLQELQTAQGASPHYLFTAVQVATSGPPQVKLSSKLRSVLAVLGAGIVLIFIVVSVGDAIDKKRQERRSQAMGAMVDEIVGLGQHVSPGTWEPSLVDDHPDSVVTYSNGGTPQDIEAPR